MKSADFWERLTSAAKTAAGLAALVVFVPAALAASAAARAASIAHGQGDPWDREAYMRKWHAERDAVIAARRASAKAKRDAREERKRLRRAWKTANPDSDMAYLSRMLGAHVARARMLRAEGQRLSHEHRELLRGVELCYAIACAAAGAVPS